MSEQDKVYISYNHVHQLVQQSADKLRKFQPDLIICVAGGGLIPARMVRTVLKVAGEPNVRIMAVVLSLYEDLGTVSTQAEKLGHQVVRTQWLDYTSSDFSLLGKNILIVDEVDDTRTTLNYAVAELQKDVAEQAARAGIKPEDANTKFGVFVLHDKLKPKRASLPDSVYNDDNYIAAKRIEDVWIAYPWESNDIVAHTAKAVQQGNDI